MFFFSLHNLMFISILFASQSGQVKRYLYTWSMFHQAICKINRNEISAISLSAYSFVRFGHWYNKNKKNKWKRGRDMEWKKKCFQMKKKINKPISRMQQSFAKFNQQITFRIEFQNRYNFICAISIEIKSKPCVHLVGHCSLFKSIRMERKWDYSLVLTSISVWYGYKLLFCAEILCYQTSNVNWLIFFFTKKWFMKQSNDENV